MLKIAAFLGEQLRKEVGGEWRQEEDHRVVRLVGLNCYILSSYPIWGNVINAWKKQSIEKLKQEYLFMHNAKMPFKENEMMELQTRWIEILKIK